MDAFAKQGRLVALLTDLAPHLRRERLMLQCMDRIGIIVEFASTGELNEKEKKYIIDGALTRLVDGECIQPKIAADYINIIAEAINYGVKINNFSGRMLVKSGDIDTTQNHNNKQDEVNVKQQKKIRKRWVIFAFIMCIISFFLSSKK